MTSSLSAGKKVVWRVYLDGACSDNHKADSSSRRAGYGIWVEPPQPPHTRENTLFAAKAVESVVESVVENVAVTSSTAIPSAEAAEMQNVEQQETDKWAFSGPLPTPPAATNNRAELLSLITALQMWFDDQLPAAKSDRVCFVMDNKYTIEIANEWLPGWRQRNYCKADGKPVLNQDLVRRLDSLLQRAARDQRDFSISWTNAHQKEPLGMPHTDLVWRDWNGNAHADRLSRVGAAGTSAIANAKTGDKQQNDSRLSNARGKRKR